MFSYIILSNYKKKYLQTIHKDTDLSTRSKQVRDFYLACMNEKAGVTSEKKEVAKRVNELKTVKTAEQLMTLQNKKLPESFGNLYGVGPTPNLDDPKKLDLYAGGNFLSLPDNKHYENAALMKDFEKLMTLFFKTVYGPGLSDAAALKKAQAIIKLEIEFAKLYPIANIRRQRWTERRISTQAEFLKKYPELKAEIIFAQIPKDTVITTPIPETLEFLNANLGKIPLEVWKDVYLLKNLD
ncbi:MAG: M13 family peptidase, partial [Proteobacteria bacterium]